MLQTLIFDSAISYIMVRHTETKQAAIKLDDLKAKSKFLVGILDHEFFTRENQTPVDDAIKNRLGLYSRLGEVKFNGDDIHLLKVKSSNNPFLFSHLNFFADMSLYLLDTYLFVILGVHEMCK